jgi:peroxiredoxin Q/BCP
LTDFKGKWIVLYFYPKDNTSGCTREAVEFTGAINEFEKLNTVVLGVSPDSVERHFKFAEKHDLKVFKVSLGFFLICAFMSLQNARIRVTIP